MSRYWNSVNVFVGISIVILHYSKSQRTGGSGKDYLQQTEQGPWFTGSCKLSNEFFCKTLFAIFNFFRFF